MTALTWVTFADAPLPMGLQTYESSVMAALLQVGQLEWNFNRTTLASVRGARTGDVRMPMGLLQRASPRAASMLGRVAYRGAGLVHRFDLRLPPSPVPEVLTIHDLPPLRFPDEGTLPHWSTATLRRVEAVIVPSQFAAQEVEQLLGRRDVVVIPNGVGEAVRHADAPTEADRRALGLISSRYVLHAGGATQRKNLQALAAAWRLVKAHVPDCELLLAGPPDARRDAAFAGVTGVRTLGFRTHAEVASLMIGAAVVVVPSTYEGFGLPALEAMSVGTPVVAADRGALPEVCRDAALLCEPTPEGLFEALRSVLEAPALQARMAGAGRARAREFTWARSATMHLAAYRRYLT